jgi:glycosyltransferase involved in cell wall biosynthesis
MITTASPSQNRPIRILQVVGGMPQHGTETWLMNVLRNIDHTRFQIDFLVFDAKPYPYNQEIQSTGSRIIPCLHPTKPWLFARNFRQIFHGQSDNRYDILHSHVNHYSGFILRLAKDAGIPVRIAHSHSASDSQSTKLSRKLYLSLTKHWINQYATLGLAASTQAANSLFGQQWLSDKRWQILQCGIDLKPFHSAINANTLRAELGIPHNATVVGHVGRFCPEKNHSFLLDIFAEIAVQNSQAYLLLVGDGPLQPEISQKVKRLNLTGRVILTGARSDVSALMLNVMDIFLFPSISEGLGLVLIEAQAAGLNCLISDAIPAEAELSSQQIQRLSLSIHPRIWAELALETLSRKTSVSHQQALQIVESSLFNIDVSTKRLVEIYQNSISLPQQLALF